MKRIIPILPCLILLVALPRPVPAEPLFSPTWGFSLDLPEGYQFSGGDGKDRFSFASPEGAAFDLIVYPGGTYPSAEALAEDASGRLGSRGDQSPFEYGGRQAVLVELEFADPRNGGRSGPGLSGWGLCLELEPRAAGEAGALLLALAYGPAERGGLEISHLSALNSLAPGAAERRTPGPIMEFVYPRGTLKPADLALSGGRAALAENDAEAAQALVDQEFALLSGYAAGPHWQEAWIRFYRAIYRDSFDRLADAAFTLERRWQGGENRDFAEKALAWVQSFAYERDFLGSDFVNPVSAAVEGRGDCDSRALLWAIILEQANIPAAIMVSRDYGHAMGLADLGGDGARFEAGGKRWLVAETTAPVSLGLIGEKVSDSGKWLGVLFE